MAVTLIRDFNPVIPGDTLGQVWPASPCDPEEPERGAGVLRDLGFNIATVPAGEGPFPYLAGDDSARAQGLAELAADPAVAGLIAARGRLRLPADRVRAGFRRAGPDRQAPDRLLRRDRAPLGPAAGGPLLHPRSPACPAWPTSPNP